MLKLNHQAYQAVEKVSGKYSMKVNAALILVFLLQALSCEQAKRLDVDAYISQQDWLEIRDLRSPKMYYQFASHFHHMMDCVRKMTCNTEEGGRRLFSVAMDEYNAFGKISSSQFNMEMTSDSIDEFKTEVYNLSSRSGILRVRYLGATMTYQPEERTYFCAQRTKEGKLSSYIYVHKEDLVELGFEKDEKTGFLKLGQERVVSGKFNIHGMVLADVYSLELVKREYRGMIEHHYFFSHEVNGRVRDEMIYNRAVLMTFERYGDENEVDGVSNVYESPLSKRLLTYNGE